MHKEKQIEHGGNLRAFAKHFRFRENEVIDFSSNINPLGIPESVRRLYLESVNELSRYPDPSSTELCHEIAKQFSVKSEQVIAGNGSMALLGLSIRALAPKQALLIEPCFSEYRRLLEQQSTKVHSISLREEDDFNFKLSEIVNALSSIDLLILGHPNNPTGSALSRTELLELLKQAARHGVYVIIDEAFSDWVSEISVANEIKEESNFIVVRSLTKFFALAGIRSGFALGPSKLIAQMKEAAEIWSVNRLAEKLSVAALRDSTFQDESHQWFREESAWFYQALKSLDSFKVFPSLANFFLIQIPTIDPMNQTLFEFLGKRNLFVRPAKNFLGLSNSYYRFALRTRKDNELLLQFLNVYADHCLFA